ncbi:hypothetical protein [Promicromonospora sp. NPDC090134]|uniref:hypothetical protein n=1 Tax=Promicromonospora sp. NPDC090134 TaxID=3364408 RepID=UPI0037FECDC1
MADLVSTDPTAASRCGATNGPHTCHQPPEHAGDHVCAGCRDLWNRGPWDDDLDPWDGTTCLDDLNDELYADEEATR